MTYIVHGWTETGSPWVDAEPVFESFKLALGRVRSLHSQGLLHRRQIDVTRRLAARTLDLEPWKASVDGLVDRRRRVDRFAVRPHPLVPRLSTANDTAGSRPASVNFPGFLTTGTFKPEGLLGSAIVILEQIEIGYADLPASTHTTLFGRLVVGFPFPDATQVPTFGEAIKQIPDG